MNKKDVKLFAEIRAGMSRGFGAKTGFLIRTFSRGLMHYGYHYFSMAGNAWECERRNADVFQSAKHAEVVRILFETGGRVVSVELDCEQMKGKSYAKAKRKAA